jgi:hypothetical protein
MQCVLIFLSVIFQDDIQYNLTDAQIAAVIDISKSCSQSIVNNCTNSQLTDMAWWIDNTGTRRNYWNGDGTAEFGCACSMNENTCANIHKSVIYDSNNEFLKKHCVFKPNFDYSNTHILR